MLASSRLSGFFRTTDANKARKFYEGVLGLEYLSENDYVLVFRGYYSIVIGQKCEEFSPLPSTILGWEVQDLEKAATQLATHGVVFERYPWMEQDKLGVWTSPDGDKVAWFKDPDGNILSLGETKGRSLIGNFYCSKQRFPLTGSLREIANCRFQIG